MQAVIITLGKKLCMYSGICIWAAVSHVGSMFHGRKIFSSGCFLALRESCGSLSSIKVVVNEL